MDTLRDRRLWLFPGLVAAGLLMWRLHVAGVY
jgi:hypothetical protein